MSSRRVKLCLLALLSALFLAPSLYGQVGNIRGKVTDEEGHPLEGVLIRIEGMNVRRRYKVKTNKKGEYYHAGVSLQGRYRVIAEKEGYRSDYAQGVSANFDRNDERGVVDFVLKKGKSGVLAFELTEEQKARIRQQAKEQEKRQRQAAAVKKEFNEAMTAYNQGNYEQAVTFFKSALEKDESQPSIWANLGSAYLKMKKYDDAIASYQKAIELSPEEPTFYQNLGGIYGALGQADKAKEMYEKAAQMNSMLDPKGAAVNYYNMGVTFINSGKNKDALEALQKAVKADPTMAEAYYQLGLTLLGLNRIEESVKALKQYLKLAPTGPNADVAQQLIDQLGK